VIGTLMQRDMIQIVLVLAEAVNQISPILFYFYFLVFLNKINFNFNIFLFVIVCNYILFQDFLRDDFQLQNKKKLINKLKIKY